MTSDTVRSNCQGETLMIAATFISILLPLTITMQRFLGRGMLEGAVKGYPGMSAGATW